MNAKGLEGYRRPILLAGLASLYLSCATPYQPKGARGGYSDFQVEPGVHYLVFEGNGYASRVLVMKYWHRRAAQLCGGEGKYEVMSQSDITANHLVSTGQALINVRKPGVDGYVRCKKEKGPIFP